MTAARQQRPIRLFLDAGVIIQGCWVPWGAAKAVLVLATLREYFTVVLAASIEREIARTEANKLAASSPADRADISNSIAGWFERVRVERYPLPAPRDIYRHAPNLLPVLKHG